MFIIMAKKRPLNFIKLRGLINLEIFINSL